MTKARVPKFSLASSLVSQESESQTCGARGGRRGGGGAYRASIQVHAKRRKLTKEDLVELNSRYRSLTWAELEEYKVMGRHATRVHAEGGAAFPSTSERTARSRDADAVPALLAASSAETLPMNFAQQSLDGQLLPFLVGDAKFDVMCGELARTLRAGKKERKEAKSKLERDMVVTAKAEAEKHFETSRLLPRMTPCEWLLHPHLADSLGLMGVVSPSSLPAVQAEGGAKKLAEKWEQSHRGLPEAAWRCRPKRLPRGRHTACQVASHCVCSPAGRRANYVVKQVQQLLKRLANDGVFKADLGHGFVLLHWQGQRVEDPSSSAANSEVNAPHLLYFTYVALQYMKPWGSTVVSFMHAGSADLSMTMPWSEAQRQGVETQMLRVASLLSVISAVCTTLSVDWTSR